MQGQFAGKNRSGASNKVAVKWESTVNEQTSRFVGFEHTVNKI